MKAAEDIKFTENNFGHGQMYYSTDDIEIAWKLGHQAKTALCSGQGNCIDLSAED